MEKELLIYGLGSVLLRGISFLLLPVYASYFSTADFGILTFLQLFATVLEWFLGFQIFSGMWRYYYEVEKDKREKLVKSSFSFSAISNFIILIFVIAILQLSIIKNMGYSRLIVIVLFTSFVHYFTDRGISILRLQRKAISFLKLNISYSLLNAISIILFIVILQQGIRSVFYGQLLAGIVIFIMFFFFMGNYKYLSFSLDKELTKKMLAFSMPIIPASMAMWVLNSSDNFFIKYFYTISDVGTYAFSYKIVMIIQLLLIIPISQAWTPFIFSRIKEKDFIKEKIDQMLQFIFAVGFILIIFLSFFSKDILALFAREDYLEGTKIIFIAGLSYVMYGSCTVMAVGYHIAEKTKILPKFFTYGAITNIILNYFFIQWFGLMGAAIATFLAFFLIFILYNMNIHNYFPLKISYKILAFIFILGFITYFLSLWIDKVYTKSLVISFKILFLFLYIGILYVVFRKSGLIKHNLKEYFIVLRKKFVLSEDIFKLSSPVIIKSQSLRVIDHRFVIKAVSNDDARLLKDYSDDNRLEGHFDRNINPRLREQGKYVGIAVFDRLKDKIAYLSWISFNSEIDTGTHYKFKLINSEAYLFDADCVPEYRRQGLHQRIMQERINYCINKDIKNIYISIYTDNYRAIHNLKKFDFKIYRKIFFIIPFKRYIIFK